MFLQFHRLVWSWYFPSGQLVQAYELALLGLRSELSYLPVGQAPQLDVFTPALYPVAHVWQLSASVEE